MEKESDYESINMQRRMSEKRKNSPSRPQYVVEMFKQGSRYEGYKLNNMRHGKGKFFYQDGGLYEGDWVNNKMTGEGKLFYQSGRLAYEGSWY
jgi:antitoxin component YwqK of YwqJK toxin-antitoxin module